MSSEVSDSSSIRQVQTRDLALIVVLTSLGPLALNILLPSMPLLQTAFQTSYANVQLTLTVFLIGFAVSQLLYGPLSDRFGRRPVMLIGTVIFVAGSLLGTVATSVEMLIVARLIQAIGGCAGLVLGRAMIRDMYSREQSASAIAAVTAVMVLAPMVSPALGSHLQDWFGWRAVMGATLVAGALGLTLALILLQETLKDPISLPGPTALLRAYMALLSKRAFLVYTAQISFTAAAFFAFLGGAPYIVQNQMGSSAQTYAYFFLLTSSGYMIGNFASARFSQRVGVDRMIRLGVTSSCLGALVMVVFSGIQHPSALFLPMILFAFGNGLTLPNATAGAVSVNPMLAGTASGLAGFLQMALGALSSAVSGWIVVFGTTQLALTLLMLGLTFVAAVAGFGQVGSKMTLNGPDDMAAAPSSAVDNVSDQKS